jgi:hypothetical protein
VALDIESQCSIVEVVLAGFLVHVQGNPALILGPLDEELHLEGLSAGEFIGVDLGEGGRSGHACTGKGRPRRLSVGHDGTSRAQQVKTLLVGLESRDSTIEVAGLAVGGKDVAEEKVSDSSLLGGRVARGRMHQFQFIEFGSCEKRERRGRRIRTVKARPTATRAKLKVC